MVWQVGALQLHAYGLVLGMAIVFGLIMAGQVGKRHGIPPREIERVAWWVMLGGIVGARVYHVVHFWGVYSENLLRSVYLWDGGLAIYGALLGGVLAMALATGQHLFGYLDMAAIVLPLSQAVGRVGNFLNQELYGLPALKPWGWYIEPENRLRGFESFDYFLPLWLYESVLDLTLFGFLLYLEKKQKLPWGKGNYFAVYLMGYGLIRTVLEPLRIDPWKLGDLLVGQVIGVLFILFGSVCLLRKRKYAA